MSGHVCRSSLGAARSSARFPSGNLNECLTFNPWEGDGVTFLRSRRYINIVAGLVINRHNQIVAVDSVNPSIFFIAEWGELLNFLDYSSVMREPSDIAVWGDQYYICDFKGHAVVVVSEDGSVLRRIGHDTVTPFPNGIDISDSGDVLIGDSHGNQFHVAVFSSDDTLLAQFTCPSVKVSRCCGLKVTSSGYVITLAKNNHHCLILDTLWVP